MKAEPKKLALVTDGIWPFVIGGMQKHSYLLCKYLAKQKIHILLLQPHTDSFSEPQMEMLFNTEERQYIEYKLIPRPKTYGFPGHYLYEEWLFSKSCYAVLRDRTDIGFIYTKGLTGWYSLNKKSTLTAPIAVKVHGYEFFQVQANWKENLNARLLSPPFQYIHRKADFAFSYGGKISDLIRAMGVPEQKIIEIPGAVEADWLTDFKNRAVSTIRKLFFIGRYERRKGVEEINQVLEELIDLIPNFEFHFAGPIPENKQLQHHRIFYHGTLNTREKIQFLMDEMDVLVCPSYSEGMPNVIMEAMSRACAVIATDVGAVPLVVDQNNGWLIPPASVEALKKAFGEALNCSPEILKNMQQNSVQKIKTGFTWDIIGEKSGDFFRRYI